MLFYSIFFIGDYFFHLSKTKSYFIIIPNLYSATRHNMIEEISEKIDAVAVFIGGKVLPVLFSLKIEGVKI